MEYKKIELNENLNDLIKNDENDDNSNNQPNNNIKDKIKKLNNEIQKRNYETLFLICISTVVGFSGKYVIAYGFYYYKGFNNSSTNETIYNNTNDTTMINKHVFYINNTVINDTILNYDLNQDIYIYISLVYISCIIISVLLLYSLMKCIFFQKKESKKKSCKCDCFITKFACQLCGCVIYFERVFLNEKDKTENKRCCECCELCCETINNYWNNIICNMCNCRKNMDYNFCCCNKFSENNFDKKAQCFCYCFQVKSFCFWFNKFIVNKTQKDIILCIII